MKAAHKTRTAIGLTMGVFLAAMESTVVATAMPEVIHELGGEHLYALPFSVYLLTTTVSSPLWGKFSDLYGRKKIYIFGILLFLLGSTLSGLSDSMQMLIGMRIIQGLGAGCVTPVTFIMNAEMFSVEKRAKVQGYMSGVWGLAGLFGPVLGGIIVDLTDWRYVFFLNIPFGIIALILVWEYYKEEISPSLFQLDWQGTILFTLGASFLVYGLEIQIWWLIVLGIVFLLLCWLIEKNHPFPLLPVKSMKMRIPGSTLILNFLAGMSYFGILAFLPLYVQRVEDKGATAAGLVLTPMVVGWTITNIIGGRILGKISLLGLIQLGFTILVFGFLGFSVWYDQPVIYLSVCGFVIGSGMGFGMLGTLLSMQEYSDKTELGSSTSGVMFARTIGGSVGVSLLSAIIGSRLTGNRAFMQEGFLHAYISCLIIAIIAWIISRRLYLRNAPVNQKQEG
ncbi:MDR family MFS transporter [Membranihabitans maritimus]|uniref:MDR family MFS transporter n=1 Tax=Membranihabitans maritimus TaxID=2904244 RepID=UPI001F3CC285|nr:MDR family MFS transporter [Membranihabitans maritimus]